MPWFKAPSGYRFGEKGSSRAALYRHRGYEELGEDTPADLVKVGGKPKPKAGKRGGSSWEKLPADADPKGDAVAALGGDQEPADGGSARDAH